MITPTVPWVKKENKINDSENNKTLRDMGLNILIEHY